MRFAALLLLAACGRIGFDASATSEGGTQAPDDVFIGGGFRHLGTVGTASCTRNASIAVTAPVPLGATLLVRVVQRGAANQTVPTVTDSGGNVYEVDAVVRDSGTALVVVLLGAHVGRELAAGDTIAVTLPDAQSSSIVVEAIDGIAPSSRISVAGSQTGITTTFDVSLAIAEMNQLVVCAVANFNHMDLVSGSFASLTTQFAACGGSSKNSTNRAGLLFASTPATYHCMGQMAASNHFAIAAVAYRPR